jgi:hypothetical protein
VAAHLAEEAGYTDVRVAILILVKAEALPLLAEPGMKRCRRAGKQVIGWRAARP